MKRLLTPLLLLLLTACGLFDKEDAPTPLEQLPPATQTGAGTFGCLIDGQAHVINNARPVREGIATADLTGQTRKLLISASNEGASNPYEDIAIFIQDTLASTESIIELTAQHDGRSALYKEGEEDEVYYRVENLLEGRVHITRFDVPGRVASGTFEMSFALDGDTVRITEGRFDLTLVL